MNNMINLFGKTKIELQEICRTEGFPSFTASQLTTWLYKKKGETFEEMTNISKGNREKLAEKYSIEKINSIRMSESTDGTKKYLFPIGEQRYIETAMIPTKERKTLCLSCQGGCKMGCEFCMTGRQGFQCHLTVAQILSQFTQIEEMDEITNIVYMGMGEPMDNINNVLASIDILTSDYGFAMSPKRITVSTIGVIPAMKRFLTESKCHLAISLHSPYPTERASMMPVENKYPIEEIIEVLKNEDFSGQRRISFEYILFGGLNDDRNHGEALARLLKGLDCRINLIGFHRIPDSPFEASSNAATEDFCELLNKRGITTTIRKSRGEDIEAACGLLSTKENNKE